MLTRGANRRRGFFPTSHQCDQFRYVGRASLGRRATVNYNVCLCRTGMNASIHAQLDCDLQRMLTLTYHGRTTIPVEVEGVVPEALRGLGVREIERLTISHGNREVPLAELFRVTGSADDEQVTFVGNLAGVHWIGAKQRSGTIRVEGDAGRHLGSGLDGGTIHVSGNAGDFAGTEMRSGLIHVRGSVGNLAGGAYRGSARGMTGGTLLIGGDAGHEIGTTMRRGLIAVGGNVGDLAAFNMIAGTILVMGKAGQRAAAGMRRGTLAVLGGAEELLPTFREAGRCRPTYLQLYAKELQSHGFAMPANFATGEWRQFTGDLLTVGKGEVLVRADH